MANSDTETSDMEEEMEITPNEERDYNTYCPDPDAPELTPEELNHLDDPRVIGKQERYLFGRLTPKEYHTASREVRAGFNRLYPDDVEYYKSLCHQMTRKREAAKKRTLEQSLESEAGPSGTQSKRTKLEDMKFGFEDWNLETIFEETGFNIEKFLSDYEYEGFNPVTIMNKIMKVRKDPKKRKNEIMLMIALNILRGNNIENMIRTSKEEIQTKIAELRREYSLSNSVGKSRKTAVTLSRVASCFPYLSCWLMTLIPGGVIGREMIRSHHADYPDYMRHPTFAGMVPSGSETWKKQLIYAHGLAQVRFSEIVNRKRGVSQKPLAHYVQDTLRYSEVARNSGFVPDATKLKYLKEWGLIEDKDNVISCSQLVVSLSITFSNTYNIPL